MGKSSGEADASSRIPRDMVINHETMKSFIANAVTKSNAMAEAYVGSVVSINKSAPVVITPSISRQKLVEEQSNDPRMGETR